jgi:hypothetical protein
LSVIHMTYKLKYSDVSGKSPLSSDLILGELAVNTLDGDLYAKNDSGVIQLLKRRPIEVPSWRETHRQGSGVEGGDPYYNFVELLLHMDGNEGAQTWIDSSKNNYTVTGQNVFNSTTTKKFGTASAKTGPGSAYLSLPGAPFNFNTRPFTIDFWIFAPAAASNLWPYWISTAMYNSGDGFYGTIDGPGTGWGGNGVISFNSASPVTNGGGLASTTVIRGAWHHIAVCRDGPKTTLFVDGHLEATHIAAGVANYGITYGNQLLFRDMDGRWPEPNTAIDDFRVTVGVVRFTKDFPVPTGPSSNYYGNIVTTYTNRQINIAASTGDPHFNKRVLGLHFNEPTNTSNLTDNSPNPKIAIAFNASSIGSTPGAFSGNGLRLNGTNDLVTIQPNTDFTLTGDFTFSCYVKFTAMGSVVYIYDDETLAEYGILFSKNASDIIGFTFMRSDKTVTYGPDLVGLLSTTVIQPNVLYHAAVTRSGDTLRIFIAGNLEGSMIIPIGVSIHSPGGVKYIGARQGNGNFQTNYMSGVVDDFYLYNGVALWTSNFTPPQQFPDNAGITEYKGWDKFKAALDVQIDQQRKAGKLPLIPQLVLSTGLYNSISVLLNDGRILIVNLENTNSGVAKLYDPVTNTLVNSSAVFPSGFFTLGKTVLMDGRVFFSPFRGSNTYPIIYDPFTDSIFNCSEAGFYDSIREIAGCVLLPDGRVLLNSYNQMYRLHIYDPFNDKVIDTGIATGSGGYFQHSQDACLLPDGRVFILPYRSDTTYIRIYDPVSNIMLTTNLILSSRGTSSGGNNIVISLRCTLLTNGKVYIGCRYNSSIAAIYDPVTNTIEELDHLPSVPDTTMFRQSILLPDGRVYLVPGGHSTPYIYDPEINSHYPVIGSNIDNVKGCLDSKGDLYLFNSAVGISKVKTNIKPSIEQQILRSPFFNTF